MDAGRLTTPAGGGVPPTLGPMDRRSTVLVAVAVALAGLAVAVGLTVVDDFEPGDAVPTDPCLATAPIIAVVEEDAEAIGMPHVTVIRPDGTRTVIGDDWVATRPAFAPDGRRLVVTRAEGDYESAGPTSETLWTIGVDGTGAAPVTEGDVYDTAAAWSPDGTTIAFVRSTPRTHRIMTVPATGGEPVELVPAAGLDPIDAVTWSPDGTRLAFVRSTQGEDGVMTGAALWTVAADGSGATRVADVDRFASRIDWHPDGSQILVSTVTGTATLTLVDLGTGGSTVIAHDATYGRWSRRGTQVVHSTRTGVIQEEGWKLVETGYVAATLGGSRDIGIADRVGPIDVAVADCAG